MEKTPRMDIDRIRRRSFFGVIALTTRTFFLQVIGLIANFILTIILLPEVYGVFFIVSAAINFLNYFSDIGLAAALIQKKSEPSRQDLVTTFTIQQTLVIIAVMTAIILSPLVENIYHFGSGGLFLFKALVVSFFLSSLKTIPSVILERKLDFQRLIIPQIIESVTFYFLSIALALKGFGVASFAWAALARGITGVLALYSIAPWKPGIGLVKKSARKLLSFGLPYQANSFLALIKDDLMTLFLGVILPFHFVGYIGWAKKWAEIGLRLIMDNIIKVTFPAFSRLQNHPELLSKALSRSVMLLALLTFPIAAGMVLMVRPLVNVVPRYIKWEPALLSFYLFTISAVLATMSSPLVNALNALGKVKYTFYLMIMWTGLTWVLVPLLVFKIGFNGVATAAMLIGLTSFAPWYYIRRYVKFAFFSNVVKPAMATIIMIGILVIVFRLIPSDQMRLLLGIPTAIVGYGIIIYFTMKKDLWSYWQLLRNKSTST